MKFRTTVLLAGKTATGVVVPPKVVESLGSSKRPAVLVTINGFTYRTTIAPMGGEFRIPISAENRDGAGVIAGDKIEVGVELDTQPREVTVPKDFAKALKANKEAKRFFESLSYTKQLRFVLSIEGAKTEETRQRRIDKAITQLQDEVA